MKQQLFSPGVCLALAFFFSSCGAHSEAPAEAASNAARTDPADQVEFMNAAIVELMARPEKDLDRVEVQHILIAFAGATRSTATRQRPDAEVLAAELYARILAGEDLADLVEEYSDDPGKPGIYTMHSQRPAPGEFLRGQMVGAFGDVGWRLEPGEIGVAPYDPKVSPFGWHIIKRLN